jgi:hypothetical protein
MTAVLVIGGWVLAVALALHTNHRLATIPTPPAPADVLPAEPGWSQARVDAEFRAMTAPLSR